MSKFAEAAQDFTDAVVAYNMDAGIFFNRGNAYYSMKQYESSLQDYKKAINYDGENAVYFHHQGLGRRVGSFYRVVLVGGDREVRVRKKNGCRCSTVPPQRQFRVGAEQSTLLVLLPTVDPPRSPPLRRRRGAVDPPRSPPDGGPKTITTSLHNCTTRQIL